MGAGQMEHKGVGALGGLGTNGRMVDRTQLVAGQVARSHLGAGRIAFRVVGAALGARWLDDRDHANCGMRCGEAMAQSE